MTIAQLFGRRGIVNIFGILMAMAGSGLPAAASTSQSSSKIVQLTWNSVSGPIVGYNLFYGGQSGIYTNEQTLGNVTTASVPCAPGMTYFFVVRSRDSLGNESPPSSEITYSLPGAAPALPLISLPFNATTNAATNALPSPGPVPPLTISLPYNGTTNASPQPTVATVRLAIQPRPVHINGISSCVVVRSTNVIAAGWALQASEDFKHWRTLQVGTNSAVNTTVISAGCSALFFRLRGL